MGNFSREDAMLCIEGFKRPVDEGIRPPLINFMVVADRLNAVTTESCHGHVNWSFPSPSIFFRLRHHSEKRSPFWKLRKRYAEYREKKEIGTVLARRADDIVFFLTREFILFYQSDMTDPLHMFSIVRTGNYAFRIVATFSIYAHSLRNAGMLDELEELMKQQRRVLEKLSEAVLMKTDTLTSLSVVDKCGCYGCQIR